MIILALTHFLAFVVDIYLIWLLLSRNHKAPLNRICSFLIATFAIWSFGYGCLNLKSVTFEVRDFGIGIPQEEQKRLFQAYHRVEQDGHRVQGVGLGLAICKLIVEAHNGRIWVTSERGKGSTFSFQIPLKQGENTAPAK